MLTLPAALGEIKHSALLALQQQKTVLNLPRPSGDFGGGAESHARGSEEPDLRAKIETTPRIPLGQAMRQPAQKSSKRGF